jgi:hypothetical protein
MRKIRSFKSQELSNTAYGIGIIGLKSSDLADEFWKSISAEMMRKIDSFNSQNLANTAYAAGILVVSGNCSLLKPWERLTRLMRRIYLTLPTPSVFWD